MQARKEEGEALRGIGEMSPAGIGGWSGVPRAIRRTSRCWPLFAGGDGPGWIDHIVDAREILGEFIGRQIEQLDRIRIGIEIPEEPTPIERHPDSHSPLMPMTAP